MIVCNQQMPSVMDGIGLFSLSLCVWCVSVCVCVCVCVGGGGGGGGGGGCKMNRQVFIDGWSGKIP